MSTKKNKGQNNPLITVFIPVIVTFSMLLGFSDSISSKPSEAGFWMILIFGVSLGVAITVTIMQVSNKNK
jgi:Na+-translocating ferredoxin:NAD+ oxidoreductase RnfE subunit